MYFNNPDIIKTETDAVFGSIKTDKSNLNFLTLINRIISVLSLHIRKDVEALMDSDISERKALSLTAEKVYSRLEMYEKIPPRDEEHLAELMMRSKNFEMWESDIKIRFYATHPDKVNDLTEIPVTKEGGISQEEIKAIKDSTNLDLILEKLSMYIDIPFSNNDYKH